VTQIDPGGGVFVPVPGGGQRVPVYSYGLPGASVSHPMFSCPQAAIPDEVWDLLHLWWQCRQMRTLPVAGALLDQPPIVRLTFPLFEQEQQRYERASGGGVAEQAAMLAIGALLKRR
jgi:hypothetical protein